MNKRKFFLLPICLLLLSACNTPTPSSNSKEEAKSSEPEVSSPAEVSSEEDISSEPHTHVFGDWQVTIRPTCTEKGEETRTCACGETETRDVDPLGHKWDEGTVTTIPTVEAKGVKTFTCERCQATKTEDIDKAKGINVTFTQGDHFKVFIYKTKAYTTETPVEGYSCYARDENGNAVDFDANAALQPQVSFKVVCDNGYSVGLNNIKITGATYKNLKQGPTVADDGVTQDLPDANHFRITKIQGDINVAITPVNGEQTFPEVKFVTNHCSVVVYKSQTISDENIVAEGPFYARDKSNGNEVMTGGQIFFKVVPEAGYVWNNGVTEEVSDLTTLPFLARKSTNSGNKFKPLGDGVYNITKVNDDLSILINCIPEGGEAGLGYTVTFATEHCHVLVYETQDYEFTPTAPVDGKALTRTDVGSAAKYVAAVAGVDANGDGDYDDDGDTAPVAEVKPQINFLVVCDEGYEFNSGIAVGAEAKAKDVSFISGKYNKLKNVGDGIYRATKIEADLTITVTATAKAS